MFALFALFAATFLSGASAPPQHQDAGVCDTCFRTLSAISSALRCAECDAVAWCSVDCRRRHFGSFECEAFAAWKRQFGVHPLPEQQSPLSTLHPPPARSTPSCVTASLRYCMLGLLVLWPRSCQRFVSLHLAPTLGLQVPCRTCRTSSSSASSPHSAEAPLRVRPSQQQRANRLRSVSRQQWTVQRQDS